MIDPDQVRRLISSAEGDRRQTHAAIVFLINDCAYKLKRPVTLPYLDYGSAAKRWQSCCDEVRLNRRTAPDLYLGILPVIGGRELHLGAMCQPGDPMPADLVDALVVMRRFDEALLLDRQCDQGLLTRRGLQSLAEAIARFHGSAPTVCRPGAAEAFAWVVRENLEELTAAPDLFDPGTLLALRTRSEVALAHWAPLLEQRGREGNVRHCHGDLHLANICMVDDQPMLFDCIEFNPSFAEIDVWYDLAFLLMDLISRGAAVEAATIFNRYLECTGDLNAVPILPLMISARASIRAKVAATLLKQSGPDDALRLRAQHYFSLACQALEPAEPRLAAVGGYSGTGKSTAARIIASQMRPWPGAVIVRSDIVRKQLAGCPDTQKLAPEFYSGDMTTATYEAMRRHLGDILALGWPAVADAVHGDAEERQALVDLARQYAVPFAGFWLEADVGDLKRRVAERRHDASDATPEVVERQAHRGSGLIDWCRIDSSGSKDATKQALQCAFLAAWGSA